MAANKQRKREKTGEIFDSIRKPTAPPSRTFGPRKPEQKARPAERKTKHKKSSEADS